MKKRFLGIFSLIALLTGFSFAQEAQYSFCATPTNGNISCNEKEICNNPGGFCRCVAFGQFNEKTEYGISHGTTCIANKKYMKNMKISSFAVSGSTISFDIEIHNDGTEKTFEMEPNHQTPIKTSELNINTDAGVCNGLLIRLQDGFFNPTCTIKENSIAKIQIKGTLANGAYLFDRIEPWFFIKENKYSIEAQQINIFPALDYGVSQKILPPHPIFSQDEAIYNIIVTNNSSINTSLPNVQVKTYLDKLLQADTTNPENVLINEISSIKPGESKEITIHSKLKNTPIANTEISTTTEIDYGLKLFTGNNKVTTTFNIIKFLDLQIESVEKTSEEPEAQGNEIGFLVKYKNKGNDELKDIILNAEISGINKTISNLNLNNLSIEGSGSILITGLIDKSYEPGTKFCLSGMITASNETEDITNNKLENICYTYVKSADLAIEAELTNELNKINNGSELTYKIRINNLGEKTATGISLKLFSSSNQKELAKIEIPTSIDGGKSYEATYKTTLTSYPARGTNISLSGEVSLAGIDSNLDNNKFLLEKELPALPDVFVKLSALPFNGWKIGDTITYTISYGNSGYGSAWNPETTLELPSFVKTEKIERNLGKSIAAGQTGEIQVIGTLTENLNVNTSFQTTARIKTDSAQISTENDISTITSTITEYNNISFNMTVRNDSWPIGNVSATHIRAASGHNVTFAINYRNDGNIPANNVSISMPNHGPLTVLSFDSISTIGIGQAGTIEIKGNIYGTNFPIINPTATLSYNNGQRETFSVTIEEPYECGDGLITRNEPCDTALNIDYGRGQSCVNQGGVCVLTTKFISNTACVEAGGVEVCDTHDLYLKEPVCENIAVTQTNGNNVSMTCNHSYAFIGTPYRIICGDNNILTGFVGLDTLGGINKNIGRSCEYSTPELASAATIRCQIGNEITNNITQPNCTKRVPSCEVDPETKVVILDEGKGSVLVQCSTNNNQDASLQIDCGNGTNSKSEIGKIIEYRCEYSERNLPSNRDGGLFNISCKMDGKAACENDVIVDQGILGICGDGIKQGYEQCDLGENGAIIKDYLDREGKIPAPRKVQGKRCYNCAIQDENTAQCLSVFNENISIEKGEYLPFWRKLDKNNFSSTKECSNYSDKNKIIKSSLKCVFELQKPGGDKEIIYNKGCWFANPYPWDYYAIFNTFKDKYMNGNTRAYAVDTSDYSISKFIGNTFGEYKLRLKSVTYDYCDEDLKLQKSQTDNICETNMTITQPYMVQKSAFGVTPKATDIDLDGFKDIDGNPIIDRTDLRNIMILDKNDYKSIDVDFMVQSFIDQAEKLAVKVSQIPRGLSQAGVKAKKVPNKDIYILEGQGKNIEVQKDAKVTKPFTIIVKNANLIIKGNMDVNGMFIAKGGTIRFETDDCNKKQVVKGIFIADNFDAEKHKNNDLNKKRCNQGGLQIKGVLIGGRVTDLVNSARSTLSKWFNVSGSDKAISVQRRNEIFRGAAVEIEYSPELWQQLPPGADEFTQMLDIYKK